MIEIYYLLRLVHILSATILFGTGLGTGKWGMRLIR